MDIWVYIILFWVGWFIADFIPFKASEILLVICLAPIVISIGLATMIIGGMYWVITWPFVNKTS